MSAGLRVLHHGLSEVPVAAANQHVEESDRTARGPSGRLLLEPRHASPVRNATV